MGHQQSALPLLPPVDQPETGTVNPQEVFVPRQGFDGLRQHTRDGIQPATLHSHPSPSPSAPPQQLQPQLVAQPIQTPFQEYDLTNTGPKQARKPAAKHQNGQSVTPSNPPQFDPRSLLNPKAAAANSAARSAAVEESVAPNGDDVVHAPGMSSLIERMHNVSDRQSVAQPKKRKSEAHDDDDDDGSPDHKKAKSTFQGFSSGGPMSEHRKEEQKKLAAKNGPSTDPIDLTAGDDDDVIVTGEKFSEDAANQEVCCGVLRCKATISRIPQVVKSLLGPDHWPRTKLKAQRGVSTALKIDLIDRAGHKCGYLELRVARALVPILNGQQMNKIRIVPYLDTHARVKGEQPGQAVSKALDVFLVIYAPRGRADNIGRHLSQHNLFLSSPQMMGLSAGKETYNPHDIKHVHGQNALNGQRKPQSSQQTYTRTQEEVQVETERMFDQLVKHENLAEREPTSRLIETELMAHQKQALHFLMDHEAVNEGHDNEDGRYSLWRPKIDKRGNQQWYNVITPQVVPTRPEPVRGGILADMMGLGKTLSILSLVAESKPEARLFHSEQPPPNSGLGLNSKATLIICPKSVMANWTEQIRTHCKPKKITSYVYHGSNRTEDLSELADYNIVLTTYNTAASDFSAKDKPLNLINWFRIVLDEAHQIRNQAAQVSKACCTFSAQRRWAVTGTPVQNGLSDLGALIKFLRVKPFDEGINWTQYIVSPLRQGDPQALQKLRLLVDSITLRRMKDKIDLRDRRHAHIKVNFSDKDRRIYEQMAQYSHKQVSLMTGEGRSNVIKGKAYAHILKSINRLRTFCAHGLDMFSDEDRKEVMEGADPDNAIAIDLGDETDVGNYKIATENQAYETLKLLSEADSDRCERCNRKIGEEKGEVDDAAEEEPSSDEDGDDTIGYLNACYHVFCPGCKDKYVAECQPRMSDDMCHTCPCCETWIRSGLFEYRKAKLREFNESRLANVKAKRKNRASRNYEVTYDGPSAKVQALLDGLRQSAAEPVPAGEPPIRSVVFSGWTTFLDLIEIAFQDNGIEFVRLDGTMSLSQRSAVIDRFNTDPSVTVMLISIKAGGQGLNLTAASKVYMMEPQWNPGVEDQAVDRVHRLGQKRDVEVFRITVENTTEDGVLKMQEKKKALASLSMERKKSKADDAKAKLEELKELFR